jgi:hypothetical protein
VEDIVAFDVALRRNDRDWVETLPDDLVAKLIVGSILLAWWLVAVATGGEVFAAHTRLLPRRSGCYCCSPFSMTLHVPSGYERRLQIPTRRTLAYEAVSPRWGSVN